MLESSMGTVNIEAAIVLGVVICVAQSEYNLTLLG